VLEEAKSGRRLDIEGSAALVRAEIQPEGAGTAMRAIGGEGPDAARGMAGRRLEAKSFVQKAPAMPVERSRTQRSEREAASRMAGLIVREVRGKR